MKCNAFSHANAKIARYHRFSKCCAWFERTNIIYPSLSLSLLTLVPLCVHKPIFTDCDVVVVIAWTREKKRNIPNSSERISFMQWIIGCPVTHYAIMEFGVADDKRGSNVKCLFSSTNWTESSAIQCFWQCLKTVYDTFVAISHWTEFRDPTDVRVLVFFTYLKFKITLNRIWIVIDFLFNHLLGYFLCIQSRDSCFPLSLFQSLKKLFI